MFMFMWMLYMTVVLKVLNMKKFKSERIFMWMWMLHVSLLLSK